MQNNNEDALFFKDVGFKNEWIKSNAEEVKYWKNKLPEEAMSGFDSRKDEYFSHYYKHDFKGSDHDLGNSIDSNKTVIIAKKIYFSTRIDLCGKELAEAVTADEKIDETIHLCFLELNA